MARLASLAAALLVAAGPARAQDVVRLGNLKFAHYGAVSYMKEHCRKFGLDVQEIVFPKGIDIFPAIVKGEVDLAASAADAAIANRAGGGQIYVIAGFARGGARLVAAKDEPVAKIADLNQALLQRQIGAMCQSEPQSSQAINKGFGKEVLKPYDTPLGEPVRVLVMTEKLYRERPQVAQKVLDCFVDATRHFIQNPKVAERYVVDQMFKGQITADDYSDAMSNAAFTYDVTPEHIQVTTDLMVKYGVGKLQAAPKAAEWVKLDLLQKAKQKAGVN